MTPHLAPGHAPDGTPLLSILGKETFDLLPGQELTPSEIQEPLRDRDDVLESELVAYKPLTDVVLLGNVHAPRGKKARFMDFGIAVGGTVAMVRVFGKRLADLSNGQVRFTDPDPFETMPIDLSHAYGGVDATSQPGTVMAYPPNPHGRGFLVQRGEQTPQVVELPNLEDPRHPLTPETFFVGSFERWRQAPPPGAFGTFPKDTHPRRTLAGMPPDQAADAEVERRKRIQAMPEIGTGPRSHPPSASPILNPEYHQVAPPALRFPFLFGNETIVLQYFHPDNPRWEFRLPGGEPRRAWIDTGNGAETLGMVLHSVEIRPDDRKLCLVWRASAYYGGPEAMRNFTRLDFGIGQ
jgi:hypothetical protein